ncbi:hydantoinase B/oxoprolinase family protein, partial [Tabrizicola sp.]|uniref:hydantoinase B/oxoprolinase family protein n=1 Tax=Tabrizicola sp. TaxID=2005166 RepID=UPI003F370561
GNGPFKVKVKVTISDDELVVDYTGTSPQAIGPINCSYTGLVTGARCLFKSVTNPGIPANGGAFRPLKIICPPGTLLSAQVPAPVSVYYEALIAAIDVFWKALAPALPHMLPAGHQRTVGATFVSGIRPENGEFYVMGEPLVGGWGASSNLDGDNGQFCCANGETYNIPCELFESRYAIEVDQYAFHNADGGAGEFRGGKGVVLDYRVTADEAFLTYAATRSSVRPWAMAGGQEGSTNYAEIHRHDGSVDRHTMCTTVPAKRDEVIRIYTATGGGFGDPLKRDRAALLQDVRNGFVTPEQAEKHYGLMIAG